MNVIKYQDQVMQHIKNISEKFPNGKKYLGDAVCRIFMHYIAKEVPSGYKVIGPNAYIYGYETEFDLLIVRESSKPIEFTSAYYPIDVLFAIECKFRGFIDNKGKIIKQFEKLRKTYSSIKESHETINFVYITFEERTKPKRNTSINYWNLTKEHLKPFESFCLRDDYTKEERLEEWQNFIDYLVGKLSL